MLKRMIFSFFRWLAVRTIYSRDPDFVIGTVYEPYMLRWWAIPRNRFFNIYVHKVLRDDEDRALHDHPWPSLSLCISGRLIEHYTSPNGAYPRKRMIKAGDWIYRNSMFAHRLELDKTFPITTITVFMTGPRIREWGFHCPQGWRHWKDFVAVEDKGRPGRGCGEMEDHEKFHCRECAKEEIRLHYYDGYCQDCAESSEYMRELTFGQYQLRLNVLTVLLIMYIAISIPLIFWVFL